jgi:hypothetical protein
MDDLCPTVNGVEQTGFGTTTGVDGTLLPQLHPALFSGFHRPFDIPGPEMPVTENAAILPP